MAYFERTGAASFRATDHVGGAWNTEEQHIAPALGLLTHLVERDRDARREDGLVVSRLSFDILGTLSVGPVTTAVTVLRPGRTIELVEATLAQGGRTAVVLRAWLQRPNDTTSVAGTDLPRIAPPEQMEHWDASSLWPGGFIASADVRRAQVEPGRAAYWVRTSLPLVSGEDVSPLASAAGLFDIANGMAVRTDPRELAFPNLDLTAHLFEQPQGEWLGFDTTVSFGPGGVGLTSSVLHDHRGPVGTLAQVLTLRAV